MRIGCKFRGCTRRGGHGWTRYFCAEHAAVLAEIRESLKREDSKKYRIRGTGPGYLDEEDERAA